jgi:hypothetical protein
MTVTKKDKLITWGNFKQTHRENWDYSEIEEFKFEEIEYQKALEELK